MKILGLVPARGGSKGIPRKNLRVIASRPLIVHSIEHGLACPLIDRVIVSTDDEEIAAVARAAGAEVPFLRPSEFATDTATDLEVFDHCLRWLLEHEGEVPDLVVQLRPTAPVRRVSTLTLAIEQIAAEPEADSLRSVSIASFSPYKMWTIGDSFELQAVMSHPVRDWYDLPRQKLPMVYQQNGFVDIVRPRTVLEMHSMAGNRILSFTHPDAVIDVDDEESLRRAEKLILAMESPGAGAATGERRMGTLQGRLSPSPSGALQNFPEDWRGEFDRVRDAGLSYIELFVERQHTPSNPVWSESGRRALIEAREQTGIDFPALCVDYVIEHPLEDLATQEYLAKLLECAKQLGISMLVLPLFESSDMLGRDVRPLIAPLRRLADAGKASKITVAIECALDAGALLRFLGLAAHPLLRVCYDTGNSAALGHDVPNDIRRLGSTIAHVHIKDKNREGVNVRLGGGVSPIREALLALDEIGYQGPMSFESVRGADPLATAKDNVAFLRTLRLPDPEWMVPRLCRAIHEAWVRTKAQHGYRLGPRIDDDARLHPAMVPYADLPAASIALESAVVRNLLDAIGPEPIQDLSALTDALCRRTHEIWMEHQRSNGISYGPVTDLANRKHRDFVPFEELSAEKKELDRAVVEGLIAELGRTAWRTA